jgi:hypothetical protein
MHVSTSRAVPAAEAAPAHRLVLILCLAVPTGYAGLSLLLGQDANWDLRNYHWYNGYAFLNGRHGFDLAPAQTPSFYNPLLDAPLFALADRLPARLAMGLWSLLQGLNFVLLFALTHVLLRADAFPSPRARVVAAALPALAGMTGAGALSLLGTTFHDNIVSLGVTGGLLVAVRGRGVLFGGPAGPAFALAALAGLPAGLAMGAKLPTVAYCIGLCLAFLAAPAHPWRRLMLSFFCGLGIIVGIAISGGHWLWLMWESYGNPLHPYFNTLFSSPFAAPTDYRDTHFADLSPWILDRLLLPFRWPADPNLVGEIPLPGDTPWRDLRIPLLYALLPLTALAGLAVRRPGSGPGAEAGTGGPLADRDAGRYVLAALALSYAAWAVLFCIYRYLVPLEMLAPLGIALAVDRLPAARRTRLVSAGALLALCAATVVPGSWGRIAWSDRLVEVEVPAVADPDRTLVLMAGYQPMSFVIPEFPPGIAFLRIQSNFVHPDPSPNGFKDLIRARLDAHDGDVFVMSTVPDTDIAADAAAFWGYRPDPSSCRIVTSNLNEPLSFCRAYRQR